MKDFEFQPESNSGTLLGGVRLPRELTDLSVWQKKPFDPAHALCDLYMVANNTSGTFRNGRGIVINYEAGEILHTAKGLADRWGWKRESVERFLVELEKSEIIRRRPIAQYGQVIKLLEFDTNPDAQPTLNLNPLGHPEGQPPGHGKGHPDEHPKGSGGDTVGEGDGSLGEEKEKGEGVAPAAGASHIPSVSEVRDWADQNFVPAAFAIERLQQAIERKDFDKPGWQHGWQKKLARFWETDQDEWLKSKKNRAARNGHGGPNASGGSPRPDGWMEGDSDWWWTNPLPDVRATLFGATQANNEKTAARLREIIAARETKS